MRRLFVALPLVGILTGCTIHGYGYRRVSPGVWGGVSYAPYGATYTYIGVHPIGPDFGGGWCHLEHSHVHEYMPWREVQSQFLWQNNAFVYSAPMQVWYSDFHPHPFGGDCWTRGRHAHPYLPGNRWNRFYSWDPGRQSYFYHRATPGQGWGRGVGSGGWPAGNSWRPVPASPVFPPPAQPQPGIQWQRNPPGGLSQPLPPTGAPQPLPPMGGVATPLPPKPCGGDAKCSSRVADGAPATFAPPVGISNPWGDDSRPPSNSPRVVERAPNPGWNVQSGWGANAPLPTAVGRPPISTRPPENMPTLSVPRRIESFGAPIAPLPRPQQFDRPIAAPRPQQEFTAPRNLPSFQSPPVMRGSGGFGRPFGNGGLPSTPPSFAPPSFGSGRSPMAPVAPMPAMPPRGGNFGRLRAL